MDASIIFSNAGPLTVVGDGATVTTNILSNTSFSRDDTSSGTVYFRYTVTNPPGPFDSGYFTCGMQLALNGGATQTLFVGKTFWDWPYDTYAPSLFDPNNYNAADIYLNSATPEAGAAYQYIRDTDVTTTIICVQYIPGTNDVVTIWLNPDLTVSESSQSTNLITSFQNNCSFSEVDLLNINYDGGTAAGGAGSGVWVYSDVVIATTGAEIGFPPPGAAQIQASGNTITLSWPGTGVLQEAPSVSGPWMDCTVQSNPQTRPTTNSAAFFRVR